MTRDGAFQLKAMKGLRVSHRTVTDLTTTTIIIVWVASTRLMTYEI